MIYCDFRTELLADGTFRHECGVCGVVRLSSRPMYNRVCREEKNSVADRAASNGPGDCLHRAIGRWTGEEPGMGCACHARMAMMNAWGPAVCREHIEEIIGWLAEEAANRGWWRWAVAAPGSRFFLKRMVLGAINESERLALLDQSPA